jgi:hypothetical protein
MTCRSCDLSATRASSVDGDRDKSVVNRVPLVPWDDAEGEGRGLSGCWELKPQRMDCNCHVAVSTELRGSLLEGLRDFSGFFAFTHL